MNKEHGWLYKNAANIVTLSAFPIMLVLLWVILCHREWTAIILILVTAERLTDWLDGGLARFLGTVTKLGGGLDRIRDKCLIAIMVLYLFLEGRVHFTVKIITVPTIVIESMLTAIWWMGVKARLDVSTVKPKTGGYGPGQLKMGFISAAILFCLFNLVVEEQWGAGYHHWATLLTNILFAISIAYGIKSYRAHQKKYQAQMSQISQMPAKKAG